MKRVLAPLILLTVILGGVYAWTRREDLKALIRGGPSLAHPASGDYAPWLEKWQAHLPVSANLEQRSESVPSLGPFGPAYEGNYRIYKLSVEVINRTGYSLGTGDHLLLVETADKPTPGQSLFSIPSGYFAQEPPEDYSGIVEIRGRTEPAKAAGDSDRATALMRKEAAEEEFFELLNAQVDFPSGIYHHLGPSHSFKYRRTSGNGTPPYAASFGAAETEKPLRIDSELKMAVVVTVPREVIVVTPRLTFRDSPSREASFRYVLTFQRDASAQGKPSAWKLASSKLVPMATKALASIVENPNTPLWQRVFATRWAGLLEKPEVVEPLARVLAARGENEALRSAVLRALGDSRQSTALPAISQVLRDSAASPRLRFSAIHASSRLGQPEATELLMSVATGKSLDEATLARSLLSSADLEKLDLAALHRFASSLETEEASTLAQGRLDAAKTRRLVGAFVASSSDYAYATASDLTGKGFSAGRLNPDKALADELLRALDSVQRRQDYRKIIPQGTLLAVALHGGGRVVGMAGLLVSNRTLVR